MLVVGTSVMSGKKMHVAVGTFGIGVETAHYLQVILAYQYLVNGRIRRCGEPDFGHFMLHLEDRIQIRMRQLWDVDPFTHRINLSEHTAVDFVAVGVGPLTIDEDYVTVGDPADDLKNDLLFIAEKMNVKYPPLPPSSRREFGMIKHFCSNNPQPKEKDIKQFCKTFKALANGDDIWPKYPTMIKPALKRWQINQLARLVLLQAGHSYTSFINKLKSETISLPPPNPRQQRNMQTTSCTNTNDNSSTRRPFVPPLCAPDQTRDVPVCTATSFTNEVGKCAYWPICKKNRNDCGGYNKELCTTYGTKNGTETSPSEKQLQQQIRLHTWSDHAKKRNCYWYPFCGKAVDCGGISQENCSIYGIDGTTTPPSDSDLRYAKAKAKKQAEKERLQRKRNSVNT